MQRGFLIAAPQSGSGKTTIALGLLQALKQRGIAVSPAKAGPDYIDPAFHAAASGVDCINLDPWAMRPELLRMLASKRGKTGRIIIEGMMGLFDGAADGSGSAADLAVLLGLPVVLVVDAASQSHSIAAQVSGFRNFRSDIEIAGVILNRVGSARHETMLRTALSNINMSVLGVIVRNESLELPSRHLGLIQAREHGKLHSFLVRAAQIIEESVDFDALLGLEANKKPDAVESVNVFPPLGQRIAVARDDAFAFIYPHLLDGWREQGAQVRYFSPLADDAPGEDSDAVFLPGGYPELHAGTISANNRFLDGLRRAALKGVFIYGECGGYMVLGEGLVDAGGTRHKMAGLLGLETSFATRKLQLGYRVIDLHENMPFGVKKAAFSAHEFHYSTVLREEGNRLFGAKDALGEDLGPKGLCAGNVVGSYMHLIDRR